MGTVCFIEEKGEINLGLGIPAGAATILAAGLYANKGGKRRRLTCWCGLVNREETSRYIIHNSARSG